MRKNFRSILSKFRLQNYPFWKMGVLRIPLIAWELMLRKTRCCEVVSFLWSDLHTWAKCFISKQCLHYWIIVGHELLGCMGQSSSQLKHIFELYYWAVMSFVVPLIVGSQVLASVWTLKSTFLTSYWVDVSPFAPLMLRVSAACRSVSSNILS